MKLIDRFTDFCNNAGADFSSAHIQHNEGFDMISFGEKAEKDKGIIYNVIVAFYDDSDVAEIYVRKRIAIKNRLELLEQLNQFNAVYRGISFFTDDDFVCAKSFCVVNDSIQDVAMLITKNIRIAQEAFDEFVWKGEK